VAGDTEETERPGPQVISGKVRDPGIDEKNMRG